MLMMRTRYPSSLSSCSISRLIRHHSTKPPSYFSDHIPPTSPNTPAPLFSHNVSHSPSTSINRATTSLPPSDSSSATTNGNGTTRTALRDVSILISILALTYFAVDSYKTSLLLEQKMVEQGVAHMKGLAVAQNNFNQQRKKKEIMALNERRAAQKREMKMVYHIAMLRKQLVDKGLKPSE